MLIIKLDERHNKLGENACLLFGREKQRFLEEPVGASTTATNKRARVEMLFFLAWDMSEYIYNCI